MVSILIPTYKRMGALATTLAALYFQTYKNTEIIVSDQNEGKNVSDDGIIKTLARLWGNKIKILKNLPRQGMAQQRQFLLSQAKGDMSLFLDDDVFLEAWAIETMARVLKEENIGFAGMAVIGLSYAGDYRPEEEQFELWKGKVTPESIQPEGPEWGRHLVHNAANLWHVQQRLKATPAELIKYKVAWIGGCVMYDTQKLKNAGGFDFYKQVPPWHVGEDVIAQLKVMAKYGGCGIMPSGAYHLELPTTINNRKNDLPKEWRDYLFEDSGGTGS